MTPTRTRRTGEVLGLTEDIVLGSSTYGAQLTDSAAEQRAASRELSQRHNISGPPAVGRLSQAEAVNTTETCMVFTNCGAVVAARHGDKPRLLSQRAYVL